MTAPDNIPLRPADMAKVATATPGQASTKAELRRHLLAARRELDAESRALAAITIGLKLQGWCARHRPASLGVYWPIAAEPDLRASFDVLHGQGLQLALPLVTAPDAPLQFARWIPGQAMQRDAFGVQVPLDPEFVPLPDVLLIPCVGFNAERFRLGYGGGFYDRTLDCTPRPITLGIAYACLQTDFAPGVHDIALDEILTER